MQPAIAPFPAHDPQLGPVVSQWKAGWTQRIALSIVSLIAGGIVVLIGAANDNVGVIVAGVVIAAGLIGLVLFFQSGVLVTVYANGIERRGRTGTKRLAWSALQGYRLNVIDQAAAAGAAGGALGALIVMGVMRLIRGNKKELTPRAVILLAADGTKVVVPDGLAGYKALIATLVPTLDNGLFPAVQHAFNQGQPVSFGDVLTVQRGVGLTGKGMFGKKHVLPMEEFLGASVAGAQLVIQKKDKKKWLAFAIPKVQNLGVFRRLMATTPPVPAPPAADGFPLAWTK
jgi:hypothetical protein